MPEPKTKNCFPHWKGGVENRNLMWEAPMCIPKLTLLILTALSIILFPLSSCFAGVLINNGAQYTNSQNVSVVVDGYPSDASTIRLWNSGEPPTDYSPPFPFPSMTVAWTLSSGDGAKTLKGT